MEIPGILPLPARRCGTTVQGGDMGTLERSYYNRHHMWKSSDVCKQCGVETFFTIRNLCDDCRSAKERRGRILSGILLVPICLAAIVGVELLFWLWLGRSLILLAIGMFVGSIIAIKMLSFLFGFDRIDERERKAPKQREPDKPVESYPQMRPKEQLAKIPEVALFIRYRYVGGGTADIISIHASGGTLSSAWCKWPFSGGSR